MLFKQLNTCISPLMTRVLEMPAPVAESVIEEHTIHGKKRTDPYSWMRDPNWRSILSSPDCLAPHIAGHLETENSYTREVLQPIDPLIETLNGEFNARMLHDQTGIEIPDGPYLYYERYLSTLDYPYYCRRPRDGSQAEEIILDDAALSRVGRRIVIACRQHSPNHRYFAWSWDSSGSESFSVSFRDMEHREDLPDILHNTSGKVVWSRNSHVIYYVARDEYDRPSKVYAHTLGEDQQDDRLIYQENDPAYYVGLQSTQSGYYAVISAYAHGANELHLIDLSNCQAESFIVEPRCTGIQYKIEHSAHPGPGYFMILTNAGDAGDFRIVIAPVTKPGSAYWESMVPHRPGCHILKHVALKHYHARVESRSGLKRIIIYNLDDSHEYELPVAGMEDEAYDLDIVGGYEYDTDNLMMYYSSLRTPGCLLEYDLSNCSCRLIKKQKVYAEYRAENYVSRRLFATTPDGRRIPLSLLYHSETLLDGSAPTFLHGYGAYGYSVVPVFSPELFSLVDRGFVYVIAHVRGGRELGCHWYSEGKLNNKMNSFSDFIASAEYLVKHKYTSRGNITAHGVSAGGTLVAAAANIAPGLFNAIIAGVPFVDVLNSLLDKDLPLTPSDWAELGNPLIDPAIYNQIAMYSPYDNLEEQDYPHVLALCGLTDSRVGYWEAAKWVARLRHCQTNHSVVLLSTDMNSGHSGPAGRFSQLKNMSISYAFAISLSGKAEQALHPEQASTLAL